jgi:hypothetical protein
LADCKKNRSCTALTTRAQSFDGQGVVVMHDAPAPIKFAQTHLQPELERFPSTAHANVHAVGDGGHKNNAVDAKSPASRPSLFKAHPDHGGTDAAFRKAHRRYESQTR